MQGDKREGRHRLLFIVQDLFFAVCAAYSLMMDMNVRSGNIYHNWSASLLTHTPAITMMFAAMFLALRVARKYVPAQGWGVRLLSLFLGAWWVLASSVVNTININQPFLSLSQMLKSMVSMMGMTVLYELLLRLLSYALQAWPRAESLENCCFTHFYRKHTVLCCALAVMVMWLPQMVIAYPCSMNNDTAVQVFQVLGLAPREANHPPFGTMLIELAIHAGKILGSHSLGLYLYVIAQYIYAVLVVSYSQYVMRLLRAPHWLRIASLLICGLMPVYCDNVTVILKDIPYAYSALLLICEAVRVRMIDGEAYSATVGHLLRVLVAGIILMNIRNNGLGIYVPVTLVLLAHALRMRNRKVILRTAVIMLLPFLCTAGIETALNRQNEIAPRSPREALSLPFQQTARFVRDHGNEIPQDERDAIDAVLFYDKIGEYYNPVLSDAVKGTYKEDATAAELAAYFKVWAKQLLRDPVCYFKATFIQNALLFDPVTYNIAIFTGTGLFEEAAQALDVYKPELLQKLEWLEGDLHWLLFSLPLVPQINSLGFYCILLVGAFVLARHNKVKNMGVIFWPMFFVLVMLVLGPCIENQDRYGFPIIYCMPVLLSCLSHGLREKHKEC